MCVFLVQSFIHLIFLFCILSSAADVFFLLSLLLLSLCYSASGCWLLSFDYFFCSIRVLYCVFAVPNFRHDTHCEREGERAESEKRKIKLSERAELTTTKNRMQKYAIDTDTHNSQKVLINPGLFYVGTHIYDIINSIRT